MTKVKIEQKYYPETTQGLIDAATATLLLFKREVGEKPALSYHLFALRTDRLSHMANRLQYKLPCLWKGEVRK